NNKVRIASINDYTAETVNIEIKLPRGVYAADVVDALYAYTECEQTIYCNLLVIRDNMPVQITVTDVIKFHAKQLIGVLKDELTVERAEQFEKLHLRTLERIFIEERIYKNIEQMKTQETVVAAVKKGFVPFKKELLRPITDDDVDHLLKIPIRRISLYDINKNRQEVEAAKNRIKEIDKLLKHLAAYAISWLDGLLAKLDAEKTQRLTTIADIEKVDVKEIVKRDIPLKYDGTSGYLGTGVSGGVEVLKITPYDRVLFVRRSGIFSVTDSPQKVFVGPGMFWCGLADKESLSKVLFTVIYRDPETKYVFVKRCRVEGYIMNRDYFFAPDGKEVLHVDTRKNFTFTLHYVKKARLKKLDESFKASAFPEKGLKAQGTRAAPKEVESVDVEPPKEA
ncbi:MAG: DNA gyrase subunit A, partial [Treponema socranskii subsp. buccale]